MMRPVGWVLVIDKIEIWPVFLLELGNLHPYSALFAVYDIQCIVFSVTVHLPFFFSRT